MKQLIIMYSMFTFKQQVIIMNDKNEVEQMSYVANDILEKTVIHYAYQQGIKNVIVRGNKKITAKLKDNLINAEMNNYHKNELVITLI